VEAGGRRLVELILRDGLGSGGGVAACVLLGPVWREGFAMRRALQEGQTPRPLQEKARSRSCPQSVHRTRANP
jgi:hypothetical protein